MTDRNNTANAIRDVIGLPVCVEDHRNSSAEQEADIEAEGIALKKERKTMNRITNSTVKRITMRGLLLVACIISLAIQPFTASPAFAATTLSVLWTAGGLSAARLLL